MSKISITPWRRVATALYDSPRDCRIFGTIEADVTRTIEYIQKQRESGNRLTLTHFVASAVARCLYEDIPDINGFVQRGNVVLREDVDVFVSVALKHGRDLTGVLIPKTHLLTVNEISDHLVEKVREKRDGQDSGTVALKNKVANIPWPFRSWVFSFIRWWGYDLGFPVPFLDIPRDPFGSIILSNIGTHGLTTGMAALLPIGRVPAVLTMGKSQKKPVVIDDEIQIRTLLPLTATMDHRIIDGAQAGILARGIAKRLRNPEDLDVPPKKKDTNT